MKPYLFVFLGRSGCGKGTQVELLSEYLKGKDLSKEIFYVSTGDEFRKLKDSNTYTAKRVTEIIGNGRLVPSFLASMMWANIFARDYDGKSHLIVDGSPRTLAEKHIFDTIFDFYGMETICEFEKVFVVYMNISRKTGTERLLGRARGDDQVEAIERRMNWFDSLIIPVIDTYRNEKKVSFHEIDGEHPVEDVHKKIIESLGI